MKNVDLDGEDNSYPSFEVKQIITPAYPMVAVFYTAPTIAVWAETIHLFGLVENKDEDGTIISVEPLFKHDHGLGQVTFEPYPNANLLAVVERSEFFGHEEEWLFKAREVSARLLAYESDRTSDDKLN